MQAVFKARLVLQDLQAQMVRQARPVLQVQLERPDLPALPVPPGLLAQQE